MDEQNETGIYELPVEKGALRELPPRCWEPHERGTNFAATWIGLNPSVPGGVERVFWDRAKGDYFYHVPPALEAGTALEIAADYTTSSGKRRRDRHYFTVLSVSEEALVLQAITITEAKDILRGKSKSVELSEDEQKLVDALAALEPDRRSLVIRAAVR